MAGFARKPVDVRTMGMMHYGDEQRLTEHRGDDRTSWCEYVRLEGPGGTYGPWNAVSATVDHHDGRCWASGYEYAL